MDRNAQPTYVSLTIERANERTEVSEGLLAILAQAINRSPSAVSQQLEHGPLKLSKVRISRDLHVLVAALKKSGLRVVAQPFEEDKKVNRSTFSDKTSRSKLSLPPSVAEIDLNWKKGEVIEGLYEVLGSAAGGMGKVYFVYHRLWKMNLAIKTPQGAAVQNETRILRFLREAELWVDLGLHPNIATCYYARVIKGVPRLFIEYVDGGDLNQWKLDGMLEDLKLLTDLMLQFCHGMMYAELKGMIHRDIKPHNCLITRSKIVKITDFGLVKRIDDAPSESRSENWISETSRRTDMSVTLFEGGIMGSPWYMAPERLTDRARDDIRSDIYSFGVMFYELATGAKPFTFPKGFSLPDLFRSHLYKKPIDPLSVRPDLPKELAEIMLTCLAKTPEGRYPSFMALCEALESAWAAVSPGDKLRKRPNLIGLKANALNNQAISLLDLGREEEAVPLLEDAHSANTDHLEAVYNLHTLRWIRGEISDREVTSRMESLKIEVRETADYYHLMGLICLQKGDAARGISLLEKSCKAADHYRRRWSEFKEGPMGFVRSLDLFPIAEAGSLAGHVKSVRSVGFSPDCKKAYSVGEDRSIRVWDLDTGRCLKNIRTFTFVPVTGAFSPDGKIAVTGYGEAFKTLDVWDLEAGRLAYRLPGMGVLSVRFSPDSRYVAALGSGDRVWVADVSRREVVWESDSSSAVPARASTVCFFGEGLALLIGGHDGALSLVCPGDRKAALQHHLHKGGVTCLDVARRTATILSGGADETVRLWEASSGKELLRFTGHAADLVEARFLPDEQYVVSVSADGITKIWDRTTARCYRTISMPGEDLTSCGISPDGRRLFSGGSRGSLRLWSLDTGWFRKDFLEPAICQPRTFEEMSRVFDSFNSSVQKFREFWKASDRARALEAFECIQALPGFCWSREAIVIRNRLQKVCKRGRLKSWSFIRSFYGHTDAVVSLDASQDGLTMLTGSLDGTAALWDVVSGRGIKRFSVNSPVTRALYVPRSQYIITASQDNVLRTWDLSGKVLSELPDVAAPIALSRGGVELAAVSKNGEPLRIDLARETVRSRGIPVRSDRFTCFSAALDTIYTLREETRIQRWSVSTGRNEGSFRDLARKIVTLEPTVANDKVVAGMEDGELIIYITSSGINVGALRGHSAPVRTLDGSKDGKHWISGSDDCSLRLWDFQDERCIAILEGHSTPIRAAHLFPNMALVASTGVNGSVRLWGLEWELSAVGC